MAGPAAGMCPVDWIRVQYVFILPVRASGYMARGVGNAIANLFMHEESM